MYCARRPTLKSDRKESVKTLQRAADRQTPTYQGIMQMQRILGNRAVGRLLTSQQPKVQTKNQTAETVQRKLEETTEEGCFTDSRDQEECSLIFQKIREDVYEELYTGKKYIYVASTDQFMDMQGNYFDPFYKATFYRTQFDGYYLDGDGQYYYYQDGYYYPYKAETTISSDTTQQQPQELPDEEAKQWLETEKIGDNITMAKAFIESYRWMSKPKAVEIIEKWNAAFPDEKISLSEYNLKPSDKLEETDEKSNESTLRNKPGTTASLEIGGHMVLCKLLTNEGGYHDIYEIVDEMPVFHRVNNSDLLVRVPVNIQENPVEKGCFMHKKIGKMVSVPHIFNNPTQDGLYVVERIANECDPSAWEGNIPLDQLSETHMKQLEQIEEILQGIANEVWYSQGGEEPVPDFRPANIRFRVNNELVLIDFSEESENHQAKEMNFFAAKIKENVNQFAGLIREKKSKANPKVIEFLTRRFPKGLLGLMQESSDFM